MQAECQPVEFPNSAGQRLFGMLHTPERNRAPGMAIVLLSPGIKGRVAPHRLYVKLARRLCEAGYQVLRFDFYGLGDSEGELEETILDDVYAAVSVGRYVGDTISAMDWLQHKHGPGQFVLMGLCGGAITGLFAGVRDSRVAALVGFGIPVVQYGDESIRVRYLSAGEQSRYRRGYLRKLLDWKSWLRLLTLRSDFKAIAKVFLSPLKRVWQRRPPAPGTASVPSSASTPAETDNLNPFFAPAFFGLLGSARKMLLVFGETDRLYWDFDEKFHQRHRAAIDQFRSQLEIRLVKEGRHVFEMREQQQDLMHTVVSWVQRHYGPV